MSKMSSWLETSTSPIPQTVRASSTWRRIQEKPSSIIIRRNRAALEAQTVRIEFANIGSLVRGRDDSIALSTKRAVVISGVRGHETLADFDVESQDQFMYDGLNYRVMDVVKTIGEIQAFADVQS